MHMKKNTYLLVAGISLTLLAAWCNRYTTTPPVPTKVAPTNTMIQETPPTVAQAPVKEFSMESFLTMNGDKPQPQYSVKEITVKKGDMVKITITATKGMHNFNIDELNIHAETPLNTPTVVEFAADKAGTYIYYCSMPGHRENGHWGTLTVTE